MPVTRTHTHIRRTAAKWRQRTVLWSNDQIPPLLRTTMHSIHNCDQLLCRMAGAQNAPHMPAFSSEMGQVILYRSLVDMRMPRLVSRGHMLSFAWQDAPKPSSSCKCLPSMIGMPTNDTTCFLERPVFCREGVMAGLCKKTSGYRGRRAP